MEIDLGKFKDSPNDLILSDSFVTKVFMWMFLALGTTALTAYMFGTNELLSSLMYKIENNGSASGITVFGWIVILMPLGFVYFISAKIEKLKFTTAVILFFVYSILMGMSFSFIFMEYTETSIGRTFLVTASMFGIMGVYGFTTKKDLTNMMSYCIMGLIGIIIATFVNIFFKSTGFDFLISIVSVVLFTAITAYDFQTIKKQGMIGFDSHESMMKNALRAALSLYLDIINLFLKVLRFMGKVKR